MVALYIILSFLFILLGWIIFVPLIIRIDTTTNRYEVSQPITFKMLFFPFQKEFLKLRVLGIRIKMTPKTDKKLPAKKEGSKRSTFRKSASAIRYLIRRIPRCIQLRYLHASVDLDNVCWNAYLMPVGYFISKDQVAISTNFYGQSYLKLRLDIRLHRILWTLIRFLTKK